MKIEKLGLNFLSRSECHFVQLHKAPLTVLLRHTIACHGSKALKNTHTRRSVERKWGKMR